MQAAGCRRGAGRARGGGRACPLARARAAGGARGAGCGRAAIRAAARPRRAGRGARFGRGRHRDPALHRRHHRPLEGRAVEPPKRVRERPAMRDRARREDRRRVPPRRADVPFGRSAGDRLYPSGRGAHVPAGLLARVGAARDGTPWRHGCFPGTHHDHHDPPGSRLRGFRPGKAAPGLLRLFADGGGMDPPRDGGAAGRRDPAGIRAHRNIAHPDHARPRGAPQGAGERALRPPQSGRAAGHRGRHADRRRRRRRGAARGGGGGGGARPQRHQRIPQPAGGNGVRVPRRLVPHRRHRADGRGGFHVPPRTARRT